MLIFIIFIGVIFLMPKNSFAIENSINDSTIVLSDSNNINSWMNDYNTDDDGNITSARISEDDDAEEQWVEF